MDIYFMKFMKIKIQQIYFYIFSCLYTLLFLLFGIDWFKFSFLRTDSDIFINLGISVHEINNL